MKKGQVIFNTARLLNVAFMVFSIYLCFVRFYNPYLPLQYYWKGKLLIVVLFAFLYFIFTDVYDAFDIKTGRVSDILFSQIIALCISDAIMFFVLIFIMKGFPNIVPALITLAVQVAFLVLWSFVSKKIYLACVPPLKTAVICSSTAGLDSIIKSHNLDVQFEIALTVSSDECARDFGVLEGIEAIFLKALSPDKDEIIKYCISSGIRVFFIPEVGDMFIYGSEKKHMLHLPVFEAGRYNPPLFFIIVKRAFDILFSLAFIIVLSPFMLIIALAVKLCDGGPVFYRQARLTKDGRQFNIIKFRSMRVDAEKGKAVLSSGESDPRITPVGRVIRKIRADELPQLINILSGSMSFVGPRPERPEIAEIYCSRFPDFSLRLQAKAGLTGYAQVYGKYNTTPEDKLKMDLMYISRPSIAEDFRIVFATIKILFEPESTEGFEDN
ncbi:MAG: sugar transferase, partial [Clostridia bacterium]|nr:sugar transferase [Clostridia bacterium]